MKTTVLCAALPQEIRGLCTLWKAATPCERKKVVGPIEIDSWRIYLLASGVGAAHMQQALESFPPKDDVDYWISIGLAGALVPDVEVGDCLVGTSIKTPKGDFYSFHYPEVLQEEIEDRCLLCVDDVVATPQDKRELHKNSGAVAVDMESAAVAHHAKQRGEDFLWIRAISDSLEETVPPGLSSCLDLEGFPSLRLTVGALFSKPALLPFLIRMGQRTHRLSKRLAVALPPILQKI